MGVGPVPVETAVGAAVDPFVARETELRTLREWRRQARAAPGAWLGLVAGESGVGKSRLVQELGQSATADGAAVLWGTAHGTGFLAFEPWAEALREFFRSAPAELVAAAVGDDAGSVAHIPWLAEVVPGANIAGVGTPTEEAVAEVVATVLGRVAAEGELLVVLDDVQWADRGSVEVLRRLRALGVGGAGYPVVLVERRPTVGDGAWHQVREAWEVVPDEVLELDRLDDAGCAALLQELDPDLANPELASAVYAASGGNAFIARALADHVSDELVAHRRHGGNGFDYVAAVPTSATELGEARLDPLPRPARRALEAAAVAGTEFDGHVLEWLDGAQEDGAQALIERSVAAGLVEPVADHDGLYRFRHGMVRDYLYGGLTQVRRQRLHRAVARAIEETAGEADAPALAFHYLEAGRSFRAEALTHAIAAARWNFTQGASDTARDLARRALLLLRELEEEPDVERARWARSALDLGDLLVLLGHPDGQPVLLDAGAAFKAVDDVAAMADCARYLLRLGDAVAFGESEEVVPFVERLLPRLDEVDAVRASNVLARYSLVLDFQGQAARQRDLSDRALELARSADDPDALAMALCWHRPSSEPKRIDDWLASARALEALGRRCSNIEYLLEGLTWVVNCELERGDATAAAVALAEATELAARVPRGQIATIRNGDLKRTMEIVLLIRRLTFAQALGSHHEAEAHLTELSRVEDEPGAPAGRIGGMVASHLGLLADHQGRLGDLADAVEVMLRQQPDVVGWRAFAAIVFAESDPPDLASADRHIRSLIARRLDDLQPDATLTMVLVLLARVVNATSDEAGARILGARLAPYAGRFSGGLLGVCTGPVDWAIGLCATTTGDIDRAVAHFASARELCRRMGARSFEARVELAWAQALLQSEADVDAPHEHAQLAHTLASELEMARVERLAEELLA